MRFLLCCLALTSFAAAADKPLNILFLFADDWGRYASIYAEHEKFPSPNQVVKTPNIDRIAREGALFSPGVCERPELHALPQFPAVRPLLLQLRTCGDPEWRGVGPGDPELPAPAQGPGLSPGQILQGGGPGEPADAPYGGQQFAYQKSGGRCNQFSQNVDKLMQEGVAVEAAKQQIYDEVRGNFDSFLAARPKGAPFGVLARADECTSQMGQRQRADAVGHQPG